MLRKYRMGFDLKALVLFMIIMLPTWVWASSPAPNDVLRAPSATPVLDGIGTACQVVFLFVLCAFLHQNRRGTTIGPLLILCIISALLYYLGWGLYYAGLTSWPVILLMTLPPCLAFGFYALHQRCYIALVPIGLFTVCHMVSAFVNHIF